MSAWRRKAIECLPHLNKEFEQPTTSIYDVFVEILAALVDAHREKDNTKLQKIYAFAEWCHEQKEKDIWNAAAVSFYEHLGDDEETLKNFSRWVKPGIYSGIRELLQLRLPKEEIQRLDKAYKFKSKPD